MALFLWAMGWRSWVSVTLLVIGLAACSAPDPNTQFCRRASLCANLALLTSVEQCAYQLPRALRGRDVDCRACIMDLSCDGLGRAIDAAHLDDEGSHGLSTICAACEASDQVRAQAWSTDGSDEPAHRPLIPGLVARGGVGTGHDTVGALCNRIESECSGEEPATELLISTIQCGEQLVKLLDPHPRPCMSCVTSLTCQGIGKLARGQAELQRLCPYCPFDLDQHCGDKPCAQDAITYFLLPGIVPRTSPAKSSALATLLGAKNRGKGEDTASAANTPSSPDDSDTSAKIRVELKDPVSP